jgi:hypothetical protein
MKTQKTQSPMSADAHAFLEALLFGYHDESFYSIYSPSDFSLEFIASVEQFIDGFTAYLSEKHVDLCEKKHALKRSFGGNVYFSLSGHGCGFWDDTDPAGKLLDDALKAYSGNRYRFEQIDLSEDLAGKLDLSFIPSALPKYRNKLFAV